MKNNKYINKGCPACEGEDLNIIGTYFYQKDERNNPIIKDVIQCVDCLKIFTEEDLKTLNIKNEN